jgi:hypothetical protein
VIRNLFAIGYVHQHPATTVTEFGKVWKDLDKETRDVGPFLSIRFDILYLFDQKYEAISKEKGNARKKAQKNLK